MKHILVILALTLFAAHAMAVNVYYIDFVAGSDSNTPTQAKSKTTPWKHQPYMANSTISGYSHAAGDQFIFKGGVTWTSGCFPVTPALGGSSGAGNDYYGVDLTWYSGASFTQPVFDCGSTVGRAFYMISYMTIDNLEMKNMLTTASFGQALIKADSPADNFLVENCYLHGWNTSNAQDGNNGACYWWSTTNARLFNCTVSNSEFTGSGHQNGTALTYVQYIDHCTMHDVGSGIVYTYSAHDNLIYNVAAPAGNVGFDPTHNHPNVMYIDNFGLTEYAYNNVVHDCAGGSGFFYPNPHGGKTIYIYNNVAWGNTGSNTTVEIDTYNYGSGNGGNVRIYNNTFIPFDSAPAIHIVMIGANQPILDSLVQANNQIIGTSVTLSDAVQGSNVTTLTNTTNLVQTVATATSQGYVVGNLYAPVNSSGGTYNAGTDESATFTTDILGVARPQFVTWDIGAYEFASAGPTPSAMAINSGGTTSTATWSASTSNGAGGSGGATLTIAALPYTLTYASGTGSTSYGFTQSMIYQGATVTWNYTQPGNGFEATSGGADVASFSANAVTNNSTQVIPVPTSLATGTPNSSQIPLTWSDASSGITSFVIYRSLTNGSFTTVVASPAAGSTSYTDTGLTSGTQYFYVIASAAQGLTSAQSASVNATTTGSGSPTTSGTLGKVVLAGKVTLE